ncbi:MAG: hypothetical protein Q8P12_06850 [bacterium]|nr:hypothetical protein [bacterium]
MAKNSSNTATLVVVGVIIIAVLAGAYLFFTGSLPEAGQGEELGEEQAAPQEIRSLAGRVTSINAAQNSFIILQAAEDRSFTVMLGENTEFIRLGFPFDITNPPPDTSFTPTREEVTIEDLQVGDQVFVRASSPVLPGDDVTDPLEVQILP